MLAGEAEDGVRQRAQAGRRRPSSPVTLARTDWLRLLMRLLQRALSRVRAGVREPATFNR
jgi:hypothetical protein